MNPSRRASTLTWLGRPRTMSLTDRRVVALRAGRIDDIEPLAAMHARCSADSVYRRYLTAFPRVSRRWQQHLLRTEVCLVAVVPDGSALVGIANLAAVEGATAELALLVEDGWQSAGLGTAMARHLGASGVLLGYRRLAAVVVADPKAVAAVLPRVGRTTFGPVSGGTRVARVALGLRSLAALSDPDAQPGAA